MVVYATVNHPHYQRWMNVGKEVPDIVMEKEREEDFPKEGINLSEFDLQEGLANSIIFSNESASKSLKYTH